MSTIPVLLICVGGELLSALPRTPKAPVFAPVADAVLRRHEDIVDELEIIIKQCIS